jgi:hypothetical protein
MYFYLPKILFSFRMHRGSGCACRLYRRALRKAYGVGLCSVEEIGSRVDLETANESEKMPPKPIKENGCPQTVRARLYQVIRKHQLDPHLVKSYGTEFCGVKDIREATANRSRISSAFS